MSLGAIIFIIFGSGELESWAKEEDDESQEMTDNVRNEKYPEDGAS